MNSHSSRPQRPLLWWALVLLVAMLSFYVHLLSTHVERGAQWRATFGVNAPAPAQRVPAEPRQRAPTLTRTAQR